MPMTAISDYLPGILSLPPANGDDTTAPFFSGAQVDAKNPQTVTGAPSVGNFINDITGSPVLDTGTQPSTAPAPVSVASSSLPIQVAQYAGIALFGVVLLGIGLFMLVSPSPKTIAKVAAG